MINEMFKIENFESVLKITQKEILFSVRDGLVSLINSNITNYFRKGQPKILEYFPKYQYQNYIIFKEIGHITFNKRSSFNNLKNHLAFIYKSRGSYFKIYSNNSLLVLVQNSIHGGEKILVTVMIGQKIIRKLRIKIDNQCIYLKHFINNFLVLVDYEINNIVLINVINFQKIEIKIPEYKFIYNDIQHLQITCSNDLKYFIVTKINESILIDQHGNLLKTFVYGKIQFSYDNKLIILIHQQDQVLKFELYQIHDQKFIKSIKLVDYNEQRRPDIIILIQENIWFDNSINQKDLKDRNCLIVQQKLLTIGDFQKL